MAGQIPLSINTFNVPSGAASFYPKGTVVVYDTTTAHQCTLPAASNAANAIGVVYEDTDPGYTAPVVTAGFVWALAGAAVNVGDTLIIGDTSGRVIPVGATASPNLIGRAVEAATAANDLILIQLLPR